MAGARRSARHRHAPSSARSLDAVMPRVLQASFTSQVFTSRHLAQGDHAHERDGIGRRSARAMYWPAAIGACASEQVATAETRVGRIERRIWRLVRHATLPPIIRRRASRRRAVLLCRWRLWCRHIGAMGWLYCRSWLVRRPAASPDAAVDAPPSCLWGAEAIVPGRR